MNKKLLAFFSFIVICFTLTECKSQNINTVQIIFFDLNDFDKTDTLIINNIDTVNRIKALFSKMNKIDAKFPRRYQITFFGKGTSELYYSNGKYVRSNRKTYVLTEGKDFVFFDSILNSKLQKRVPHNQ